MSTQPPTSLRQKLKAFLLENRLQAFPLHSITNGLCTCKNPSCTSQGKHPLLRKNWKLVATSSVEQIDGWLQNENVNMAIATGKWSEASSKFLVVIDIDQEEHPILSELPRTFSYRTGRMGHHLWFWSKFPIANSVSKLAPSVDVRGENGYVVIPPSRHISGRDYWFEPQDLAASEFPAIADLPDFVVERLDRYAREEKQNKKRGSSSIGEKPSGTSRRVASIPSEQVLSKWTKTPIREVRSFLSLGETIPVGVRNCVLHRLLSSDRAKGATETDLWRNAKAYVQKCDAQKTSPIGELEIKATISQVLKYSSYNTSHEKVNQTFFAYMARSKRQIGLSEEEKTSIQATDDRFFAGLIPSQKGEYVSLEQISLTREKYFIGHGIARYSKYPMPLLAKKLESLGFVRKRTNRGNVWNVCISGVEIKPVEFPANNSLKTEMNGDILKESDDMSFFMCMSSLHECRSKQMMPGLVSPSKNTKSKMSTTSLPNNGSPAASAPAAPVPAPAGHTPPSPTPTATSGALGTPAPSPAYETMNIKVTVRKHPSEKRYCGRVNRDSNDALMKFMYLLSDQDRHDLFNGTYVHDEEATAQEFDSVLPGDRIGILLQYEDGWVPSIYEVQKVENDLLYAQEILEKPRGSSEPDMGPTVEIAFEDVSAAMAMGYFEILYRPDPADSSKFIPYGIEREREVKVLIPVDPNAPPPTQPAAIPPAATTPPVQPPPTPPLTASPIPTPITPPSTPEELAGWVAGAGLTADQIRALGEGLGIDMTAKGPAVAARGRATPENGEANEMEQGNDSSPDSEVAAPIPSTDNNS